ncbi:hypothetical protein DFJ73DRAFT_957748 [Zopfochytrium polystomum]|nr:hypothetical protein DFJ73DRAFT_957748 [Zopfochytrium polystomum]
MPWSSPDVRRAAQSPISIHSEPLESSSRSRSGRGTTLYLDLIPHSPSPDYLALRSQGSSIASSTEGGGHAGDGNRRSESLASSAEDSGRAGDGNRTSESGNGIEVVFDEEDDDEEGQSDGMWGSGGVVVDLCGVGVGSGSSRGRGQSRGRGRGGRGRGRAKRKRGEEQQRHTPAQRPGVGPGKQRQQANSGVKRQIQLPVTKRGFGAAAVVRTSQTASTDDVIEVVSPTSELGATQILQASVYRTDVLKRSVADSPAASGASAAPSQPLVDPKLIGVAAITSNIIGPDWSLFRASSLTNFHAAPTFLRQYELLLKNTLITKLDKAPTPQIPSTPASAFPFTTSNPLQLDQPPQAPALQPSLSVSVQLRVLGVPVPSITPAGSPSLLASRRLRSAVTSGRVQSIESAQPVSVWGSKEEVDGRGVTETAAGISGEDKYTEAVVEALGKGRLVGVEVKVHVVKTSSAAWKKVVEEERFRLILLGSGDNAVDSSHSEDSIHFPLAMLTGSPKLAQICAEWMGQQFSCNMTSFRLYSSDMECLFNAWLISSGSRMSFYQDTSIQLHPSTLAFWKTSAWLDLAFSHSADSAKLQSDPFSLWLVDSSSDEESRRSVTSSPVVPPAPFAVEITPEKAQILSYECFLKPAFLQTGPRPTPLVLLGKAHNESMLVGTAPQILRMATNVVVLTQAGVAKFTPTPKPLITALLLAQLVGIAQKQH